jgi:hypothetical protein
MHTRVILVAIFSLATSFDNGAMACDELASKVLSAHLGPAVRSLGCPISGGVNLYADHKLESICYTSKGRMSSIEIIATLTCRSKNDSVLQMSVSDQVAVHAQIRDCSTIGIIDVRTSGVIGSVLIEALEEKGRAREAIQAGLDKLCSR